MPPIGRAAPTSRSARYRSCIASWAAFEFLGRPEISQDTSGLSKQEFAKRFKSELDDAARKVQERLGGQVKRSYRIAFLDPNRRPLIDFDSAVDKLFARAPLFAAIIDISVIEVYDDATVVFVRPSAHAPTTWDRTWNVPPGRGPFKILIAENVKDRRAN